MRRSLLILGALGGGTTCAAALWWRRHPRSGTRFVNEVVGPRLMERGIAGRSRGEIAVLEHVGRRSGTVRLTLVHPERIADGIRIMIPLGGASEWAKNVLAAGHCRMQLGETIVELDEPILLEPSEVEDVPAPVRALYGWLGFRYLRLHRFAERPGTLAPEAPTPGADAEIPTADAPAAGAPIPTPA